MKRILLAFALLFGTLTAHAQFRVTATVTVTNSITNGSTFVVNGGTRTWTNAISNSVTQIIISNSPSLTQNATNLFNQISANPYSPPIITSVATSNVTMVAQVNQTLSITAGGTWALVTYATSTVSAAVTVRVPITVESSSNQTMIASALVSNVFNLSLSTNLVLPSSTAMSNFVNTSTAQSIAGQKTFTAGATFTAQMTNVTGSTFSNANVNSSLLSNDVSYNLVNRGTPIQSFINNALNVEIGTNSYVTNGATGGVAIGSQAGLTANGNGVAIGTASLGANNAVAIGNTANGNANRATAVGAVSSAQTQGVAIGYSPTAGANAVAIGASANATNANSVAVGVSASTGIYASSAAIGASATATAANQIRLGTASETVSVPGSLQIAGTLNSTGGIISTNAILVTSTLGGTFAGVATLTNSTHRGAFLSYINDISNVEIGTGATVTAPRISAVSIGKNTTANGDYAVAVGVAASAVGAESISIGDTASANAVYAISIGNASSSLGVGSMALGFSAGAASTFDIAIGGGSTTLGPGAVAIGLNASSQYTNSVSIGQDATAQQVNQIRLGTSTQKVSAPGSLEVGGNVAIGSPGSGQFITGMTKGLVFTNGVGATADPSAGAGIWAASGNLEYRTSLASEGAGQTNRVHNRGAQVVGVGTSYSATTTMTNVVFGTTSPQITLPSDGTYLITAVVTIVNGGTANDQYNLQLWNNTTAAIVAGPTTIIQFLPASKTGTFSWSVIATVTAANDIYLQAQNADAARGTIFAIDTSILYVRLY